MNAAIISAVSLRNTLPGYILLLGEKAAADPLLRLIAEIAPKQALDVIDAGSHFNPHLIARRVRRESPLVRQAMQNIHIARLFHAHQLPDAMQALQPHQRPLIIMGGMILFEDETIPPHQKHFIFQQYLYWLRHLAATRPVILGIKPAAHLQQQPWQAIYEYAAQWYETDCDTGKIDLQPGLFDSLGDTHG